MKKIIALIIAIAIVISVVLIFAFCGKKDTPTEPPIEYMNQPTINGVALGEFSIVYDEQGLDYNKRAAEYIKNTAQARYGLDLAIVDDDSASNAHEIVVGETSRAISASLNEETSGLEFSILADGGSVALEGDYFVIAAAAYYFMETYALTDGQISSVSETAEVHEPITKEAKNFIMLIGDGMGVYQTLMFDYMKNDVEYGDGEDLFYGYMLPYMGYSRTDSLEAPKYITDSAAGGTALSCGYKTFNGYVGLNRGREPVQNITELANELGMSAAVMSTEAYTGATPASFLVHVGSRHNETDIIKEVFAAREQYGTIVECDFDYYTTKYMGVIENKVTDVIGKVSANENGFFLMYEEAHIDKHCHNNEMDKVFDAVVRFNQVIARFMEFAFYNPETAILITADHETGELLPDESGNLAFNSEEHSGADVCIFAYGHGMELFDGVNIENIQIAHTVAALMGDENFGDQSEYQSLTKGNK